MHEKDIYLLAPGYEDLDKLGSLVETLKQDLRVTCNEAYHAAVFEKVKSFVVFWTRKWIRDFGFIYENSNGGITKAPEFHSSLEDRRRLWNLAVGLFIHTSLLSGILTFAFRENLLHPYKALIPTSMIATEENASEYQRAKFLIDSSAQKYRMEVML